MRHDNIEHRRLRPEPFTVEGDLAFVLRTFGLPEDMSAAAAEERFCSQEALVCSITGTSCMVTTWVCAHGGEPRYTLKVVPVYTAKRSDVPTFGSSPVYTTGPHMGEAASNVDPWVKVGTTTIDGTLVDIANVLDVSSWPIDWARDAKAAIDLFMRAETPWLVGGRRLVAKRSHVNTIDETAVIHCDIVRRLSECCVYCDRDHLTDAQRERAPECSACSSSIAAKMSQRPDVRAIAEKHGLKYREHVCPECGPHGNRGEVLLASSWAKCTTCAGGKPGDLWGEVKAHEPATAQEALSSALIAEGASSEVAQAGVRAFIDALNRPPSFEAKKLSNLYLAEIDNLRRHLMEPPDHMSREEYRRIMFGEWVP